MSIDWKEEIEWCISHAKKSVDIDQITRHKDYTSKELLKNAPSNLVQKLMEVLHTNILDSFGDEKDYARVLLKNLESKHGYTPDRSQQSSSPSITINIPSSLMPREVRNITDQESDNQKLIEHE